MSLRLMPLLLLSLLLWLGTVKAATHVNISIGHQAATNPADVTYVDGQAPAELRAGPISAKHQSDFSFRGDGKSIGGANYEYSQGSARLTASNDGNHAHFGGIQSASARLREQDRQNQEFERYIQNYHSGPTVETVFETATPSSSQRKKSLSTSSSGSSFSSSSSGGQSQRLVAIGSRPSQVHTFERQVALPTAAPTATLLPPSDDRQTHTIVNHQPKNVNVDMGLSSSSSSSSFDQSSFDSTGTNFNKPNYGYDDSDVQHQFPPTVDEPHTSFGIGGSGFYSGNEQTSHFGGSTPAPGYLPSYPRPVVTKTIQIAQPALKAKKFEIRHPAVQKEFYDIEERVVIKPAGTIVVELERPVAKIPKGETVLPLGHPHPAVASAYNTNGAAIVQTMGSDVVSNGANNNQYSPSPVYNPKGSATVESQYPLHAAPIGSTTIASTVTTTPSYDASSMDEFVEANLNKQYNGDAQYVTTTERSFGDDNQSNEGFYATTTESNRNYGAQFYNREETDRRYPSQVVGRVEVKNNGAPGVSTAYAGNKQYNNFAVNSQATYGASPVQYQPSFTDNNQYKGEFFSGEFYNQQQGPKPARLQEQPRTHGSAISGHTTHVIKHEHNIHLPASQHNIYLGRIEQDSSFNGRSEQKAQLRSGSRYNEEAAQVLGLKPYLKNHPGSVVVYASSKLQPSTTSFSNRYTQQHGHEYGRYARPYEQRQQAYAVNNVQYSAPYTNMRFYSDQSPRYVYGSEFNYKDKSSNFAAESVNTNDGYQSDAASTGLATKHQAHIQIQIPHHSKEVIKPIVVTSTVSPVVHNVDEEISSNYRRKTSQNQDGDAERFTLNNDYRRGQNEFHHNSGHQNARFEASQIDFDRNTVEAGEFAKYKHSSSPQKSLRIIESSAAGESGSTSSGTSHNIGSLQSGSVDVNLKSSIGHVATPGSRVIAATPAPTDASATSESFHKRRIVVNHPFQTVREVVEHEPITNYHHVQVNEPASPELYHHTAPYYQQDSHGSLRQVETIPLLYHHHSAQTHGNLHYGPVLPLVHVGYHHHG